MLTHVDFEGQMTWYAYDDDPDDGGRREAEYRYATAFTPSAGQNPESTQYDEKTVYIYDDDEQNENGKRVRDRYGSVR